VPFIVVGLGRDAEAGQAALLIEDKVSERRDARIAETLAAYAGFARATTGFNGFVSPRWSERLSYHKRGGRFSSEGGRPEACRSSARVHNSARCSRELPGQGLDILTEPSSDGFASLRFGLIDGPHGPLPSVSY
jgi:hypothetical protein